MSISSTILQLTTSLSDPATRLTAARELATALGGESVLVFVRDPEVDQLLTAPGFPQTLPNGRLWRAFLQQCIEHGQHSGEISVTRADERVPAFGMSASQDVVFVLLGTATPNTLIEQFRLLLPLVAAAFRGELQASLASIQARHAEENARNADKLTKTLLELNQQLQDARAAAERANRAKSEFLTTMSHELRTPLNAISGYVQLLELGVHGPLTKPQLEALSRVNHSQRHLLRLINDILSLARIEAGGITYHIRDVAVHEALRDVVPLIEPQLAEKNLRLDATPPDDDLIVRADREKLDQILLNLLSNAVKFTPPGGTITVSSDWEDGAGSKAFISVADTGRGIPSDMLDGIFQPFVQVNTGLTRTHEGSGLGLAISRDLAQGMEGTLSVMSKLGSGSVFTLRLPVSAMARRGSPARFTTSFAVQD